ncbi:hypothetical protein HG530_003452 [Fusarium avenaceum]|nr:hypothetical protein HG530_003452 [Fusarium avenaceum]
MSIKSSGSHQGLVEHIRSVSTSENDNLFAGVETIHLSENLVQGRFPLVVTTEASAALLSGTSNCVNLIDKDDTGSILAAFGKQISHTRRTDTHEHLNEFGTAHTEEGHSRLASRGLGKQRLSSTRRASQDSTSRDLGTQLLELLRLLQEANKLHDLSLGLLKASNI